MAFVAIDNGEIEVGDPQTAELWEKVKENLDDLDSRVSALATSGKYYIFNTKYNIGANADLSNIDDFEIILNTRITEVAIQLYSKSPATSGTLSVDILKNTNTNPSGFASILTTQASFNMAVASNYSRTAATINTSLNDVSIGEIIKVSITSLPVGLQYFRLVVVGEY